MINEDFLKCLEVAKTLTQSSDIDVLIAAAHKIYAATGSPPPKETFSLRGYAAPEAFQHLLQNPIPEKLKDFLPHVSVMHPVKGAIPLKLHPYQERFCDFLQGEQSRKLAVFARQMGLTTILAGHALHDAVSNPDQTILIVSNKFVSAVEIMSRIRVMVDNCAVNLPRTVTYNKSDISFGNGSRILARAISADSVRGLSLSTLIIDSAAYMSHSREEEFYQAIMPTMSLGSRLISTSAAGSDKGLFYQHWKGAREFPHHDTATFECKWDEHPDRDEAWADNYRRMLGAEEFAVSYECKFSSK